MKKLIAIFGVFAMTAGMAFSQNNDASINQSGNDHDAKIEQIGSLNKSYVLQRDGSETNGLSVSIADIYQEGEENYVNIDQRSFHGFANNNVVLIDQVGDNNTVRGKNVGDAWFQNHSGNYLKVDMDGDRNTLRSLASEAQKNYNSLELNILGDDNDVASAQHFGYATIDIEGNENNVSLWQHASNRHDADIDIVGSSNVVNVDQRGNAHNAVVNILGSGNNSQIIQSGL